MLGIIFKGIASSLLMLVGGGVILFGAIVFFDLVLSIFHNDNLMDF